MVERSSGSHAPFVRRTAAPPRIPFGPGTATRVLAVTSGKGGVGKSTLAVNLAVAFADHGKKVGVIDADVHGFSVPGLLGLTGAQPVREAGVLRPPSAYGVSAISIGMFTDGSQAVSWRGPKLHRTLQQFLSDVSFGDPDVLLIDLPPGTGDIAISLGQFLPNAEVVVVTTPQPAAAAVAERSGRLARRLGQRIAGVVETMSGLAQPDGSVLELFGSGGGAETARRLSTETETVPLLGQVPLSIALREGGDSGIPVVVAHPEDPASREITSIVAALLETWNEAAAAAAQAPAEA